MYNPNNYFFPGYGMFGPSNVIGNASRGLGLFRNLGRGAGLFRNINWGTIFNNASRALGVVNQAIPIVKQAGPMFNNMKSMLKVASAFKDVTDEDRIKEKKDTRKSSNLSNNYNTNFNNNNYSYNNIDTTYSVDNTYSLRDKYNVNNNNPNFFI
jgi:hypothetical protein